MNTSRLIALWLIAAFASGCAQVTTRVSWQRDRDGVLVQVLEIEGAPCPANLYATPNDGCALQEAVRVIFYRGEQVRAHELEHIAGLVHGHWVEYIGKRCTVVLQAGSTGRTVGDEICFTQSVRLME